ncbi:hypothetical protein P7B02_00510 [Caulobacter segnis]|uniref:hypothetical protein n=1 Tax=Caulobacter segnis TaxID=88688 RepID=UPI00240EB835|nr:hypothetical protein [Caulobacter segnis]MDG2520003.1 hypothetical protein [Caulobacter segnis]
MLTDNLQLLITAILATAGLGTAAMGLVEAIKAAPGCWLSSIGFKRILAVTREFDGALSAAVGPNWSAMLSAHWVNGRPRAEQKAIIRSLLRLGLVDGAVDQLAKAGNVKEASLKSVAGKLQTGGDLSDVELTLLGRVEAVVEAKLDAAFDIAEQHYKNAARLWAAFFAILLALVAWALLQQSWTWSDAMARELMLALAAGAAAVPMAPVAKDLVAALSASAKAVKAAKVL